MNDRPRRSWALVGMVMAAIVAGAYVVADRGLLWSVVTEASEARSLSVEDAHRMALAGEITLIDIRRPDEWAATGIPEGALALDMRREDFAAALLDLAGSTDAPIALICARGVRSAAMSNRLIEAGFTQIIDVPEGMFGSRAGPGWLARDLPREDA